MLHSIGPADKAASRASDIIAHVHKTAADQQHSRAENIRVLSKALNSDHVNVHFALDNFNKTVIMSLRIRLHVLGCPMTDVLPV